MSRARAFYPSGPVLRVLLRPVLLKTLAVLALIEGVFLAETFEGLMNAVLEHGGSFKGLAWLLALNAPEIAALALALAMLIALFFALSDARARGELIILAASGIGWQRVVGFALLLGLLGGAAAWGIAGQLVPRAHHAERLAIAAIKADHIRAQILGNGPRNTVQGTRNLTFVTPDPDAENPPLFVFQETGDGQWRAGVSPDWGIEGPDDQGRHALVMRSLSGYSGNLPRAANGDAPRADAIHTRAAEFAFAMDSILPAIDRARQAGEQPMPLLSPADPGVRATLLARALLVPMAALLALVALVTGRGLARFIALPFAVLAVMAIDVAGRAILPALPLPFAALAALTALVYLAPPLAILARAGERLMIPDRGAP